MSSTGTTASTVGAHDAKTNLSQLLDRVERGEVIVIVRHGEPVARLIPFSEVIDRKKVEAAIAAMLELQRRQTLGDDLTVESLINEGREH